MLPLQRPQTQILGSRSGMTYINFLTFLKENILILFSKIHHGRHQLRRSQRWINQNDCFFRNRYELTYILFALSYILGFRHIL